MQLCLQPQETPTRAETGKVFMEGGLRVRSGPRQTHRPIPHSVERQEGETLQACRSQWQVIGRVNNVSDIESQISVTQALADSAPKSYWVSRKKQN